MRVVRWLVASLLLAWTGSPAWSRPLDDVFVVLAYAHEWASTGILRWTSGQVVEGYSGFLWLGLLTAGVKLGADGALLAHVLSLACGVGVLALASALVPADVAGTLLVLVLAVWAPLARWSEMGLEGPLYAGLLVAGWTLAIRPRTWGPGVALLAISGLVRPEGTAQAVLGLATLVLRRDDRLRRADVAGGLGLAAFVAYHAVRMRYFGAFWPTAALVDVGGPGLDGLRDVGRDLLVAVGPIAAAVLPFRVRREVAAVAAIPAVLQLAVLLGVNGDGGVGRLAFPGIAATCVAWAANGERRPVTPWAAVVALPTVVFGLRDVAALTGPLDAFGRGFETPLPADVAWIVEHVPDGDAALIGDVGLPGQVPGVRIRDPRGVVDRPFAEAAAGLGPSPLDVGILGRGPGAVQFWLAPDGWRRTTDDAPSPATILARWAALAGRYPSQPWLVWRYALALADAGRLDEARGAMTSAGRLWPRRPILADVDAALSFPAATVPLDWQPRGFAAYEDGSLVSRPLGRDEIRRTSLALDGDAFGAEGIRVDVRWLGCGDALGLSTHGPVRWRLPEPSCPGEAWRLEVRYTNDAAGADGDRNLYAALRPADGALPWPGDAPVTPFGGDPRPEDAPGRGQALYWNREVATGPRADWTGLVLALDADAPGTGALARYRWEPACGSSATDVAVVAPVAVPLSAPVGCGDESLVVGFLNDGSDGGGDRNLYAAVRQGAPAARGDEPVDRPPR